MAELAKAQEVVPVEDVRVFYGTWPGEPEDGFEALIDEHRHAASLWSWLLGQTVYFLECIGTVARKWTLNKQSFLWLQSAW